MTKGKFQEAVNLKLEENRTGIWTLSGLRKSITKLLVARERSEGADANIYEFSEVDYTAEGLLGRERTIICCFCEKNHWTDECQMFKTIDERKSKLRGRCYNCLSGNDLVAQCRSDKTCFYCKQKRHHHSSLCPEKFGGK